MNDWKKVDSKPRAYTGKCEIHGEWVNYIENECAVEAWERERNPNYKAEKIDPPGRN